jgi:hypothetical protein
MKKVLTLASGLLLFGATNLQAQNWVNNGNTLSGNGTIGTNSNHSLVFETNNTERGRITNTGLWGIGTGTTLPTAKFQINSTIAQNPLRVQVDTKTKFLVHKAGGVSIGANVTPPVDGLYVAESIGIGVATPDSRLHINSTTDQDPLRLQVDGLTKLLVHRSGGVAIGAEETDIPPANGLFVAGDVGIGTNLPPYKTKLYVENLLDEGTGISTNGDSYGLRATAISTGIQGSGGDVGVRGMSNSRFGVVGSAYGGLAGVFAESDAVGVRGVGSDSGTGGMFTSTYGNGLYASTFEGSYAAYFAGDTFTSGTSFQGSDKNIKKNIQEMSNATDLINQLKPKYYQFRDDGKYASLMLPKGNHYGLLAQDVEEVLPTLVKETLHEVRDQKPMPKLGPDGKLDLSAVSKEPKEKITIKAVNYTEFIPIMIKALQEQQATIEQQNITNEQQNAKIEELTLLVHKLSQKDNSTVSVKPTDAYLSYSNPNPNSVSARINYNIPTGATKAHLVITNATGQQLKKITLNNSGSVEVNTTSLSAGIYFYSLFIDDNLFDTKKMLIVR